MAAVAETEAASSGSRLYLQHSPRSVALVAMGPSAMAFLADRLTQEMTPAWCDEIWAINMAAFGLQHDVVFWMDDLIAQNEFKPGCMDMLNRLGKPVVTTDRQPSIVPNSFDYPYQEVCTLGWPLFGKPYLNNGVAMAIGYALWKGVKRLRIYGADFTYPNRNFAEEGRGCVEAWCALCTMRGMQVDVAPTSGLFDAGGSRGIYGFRVQPTVIAPDGTPFRFMMASEAQAYVAEDSSGAA